jgi:hypothetical protein
MGTGILLSAQQTFGSVYLGHRGRTQQAVRMAIVTEPMASLPKQVGSELEEHAAYRFLQTPDISYEHLVGPYVQQTREAMDQQHASTTGSGPVGNASHQGYLLQSVLAVEPTSKQVLSLAHQEPFLRQPVPLGETRQQREKGEREPRVWQSSVQAIGVPPDGVQWIHRGDLYSDRFSFLQECGHQHCDLVARAAQESLCGPAGRAGRCPCAPALPPAGHSYSTNFTL